MSQLPDWHRLVVSAVDGELSHQDRKKLRELLRTNAEAKILLRDYRAQSKSLSELPPPPLPCDFASVFKTEPEILGSRTTIQPQEKAFAYSGKPKANSFATAAWVAIALGILLFTSIGVNYLFQPRKSSLSDFNPGAKLDTLAKSSSNLAKSQNLVIKGEVFANQGMHQNPMESQTLVTNLGKSTESPDKTINKPERLEAQANQQAKPIEIPGLPKSTNQTGPKESIEETLLTAPFANSGTLVEPKIQVPDWISWEEKLLGERLRDASREGSAPLVLEVPCNDSIAVSGHLVQVLKNQKMGVVVDQLAQDRLFQKNIRSHFAICLEGFTPADLEKLLSNLKKEVERSPSKTAIPPLGQGIALLPANADRPMVFSTVTSLPTRGKSGELLQETSGPQSGSKTGEKNNATAKKSMQPSFNPQGRLDALVMAQSPYYPEVRTSPSSQEVSLFRKLKKETKDPGLRIFIFLRQLHI
jgi:hypothetical protein